MGAAVLIASFIGARGPAIRPWEQRVFRAINGLPDWLYWPLWVPMQLGNLVVGPLVGLAIAALTRDLGVAIAVVVAVVLKVGVERLLRRWLAGNLEVRQRPGTSEPGARLRGADVPASGPSFPSGHVILVAEVATILTTNLSPAVAWVPLALCLVVAVGRVYVGAHNPLDVTAGLGVGMVVGALLTIPLH